jgi:ABC-type uncharacterized transport system ATPase subunit
VNAAAAATDDIAIAFSGITKRFPGVVANDGISLAFRRGEVHALLGENGAGKSTLIGIMSGMLAPDEGRIEVDGRATRLSSPADALRLGIGTVFQHMMLVPGLTVLENLMLGAPWWRLRSRSRALARFRELAGLLSVDPDPDAPVGRLSPGEQQQVEIMRALWHGGRVLILDEPTSMLTPKGVAELGAVVRRLRDHGVAVVFVTHKLREAHALADRISVLRRGRVVGALGPEQLRAMGEAEVLDAVVAMMFGRTERADALGEVLAGGVGAGPALRPVDRTRPPRLVLSGVSTVGARGECALAGVSLKVWPGEVLGIAGVDGNGQKHLAEVLAGQRPVSAGSIMLDGREIAALGVPARRALGVRYVTDERLDEGIAGEHPVAVNLVLKEIGRPPLWRAGIACWGAINAHARDLICAHDVRTPSERTPIAWLSGGNIQKVLLARELSPDATLVVLGKPTHGLDLQTTRLARERIRNGAGARDAALVVISNELEELLETCHRIAVLDRGTIRGIVDNRPDAERAVGRLMTGIAHAA